MFYYVEVELSWNLYDKMELDYGNSIDLQQLMEIYRTKWIKNLNLFKVEERRICLGVRVSQGDFLADQEVQKVKNHIEMKENMSKILMTYLRKRMEGCDFDLIHLFSLLKMVPLSSKDYKQALKQANKDQMGYIYKKILPELAEKDKKGHVQEAINYIKAMVKGKNSPSEKKHIFIKSSYVKSKKLINAFLEIIYQDYHLKHRIYEVRMDFSARDINLLRNKRRQHIVVVRDYDALNQTRSQNIEESLIEISQYHILLIGNMQHNITQLMTLPNLLCEMEEETQQEDHRHLATASKVTIETTIDETLSEINSMIGLNKAKETIKEVIINAYVEKNIWHRTMGTGNHFMFMGNPGTGKTTLARYLAKGLYHATVLESNRCKEVDRAQLVGQHVGATAIKTRKVLEEARGGMLFIDEAYSLSSESHVDFGREALHTIVKYMEDYRSQIAVVLAGYKKPMEQLFKMNEGLKSRVNHMITFEDYSADELLQIFYQLAKKDSFEIEEALGEKLFFELESLFACHLESFSNGRFIRNVYEATKRRCARRLYQQTVTSDHEEQLRLLKVVDFCQDLFTHVPRQEQTRQIGF